MSILDAAKRKLKPVYISVGIGAMMTMVMNIISRSKENRIIVLTTVARVEKNIGA